MKSPSSRGLLLLLAALLLVVLILPLSAETVAVPFTGGVNAATTVASYSGSVLITVSGTGTVAATPPTNDAFYIFTDAAGVDATPVSPDLAVIVDTGLLLINGAPAQSFISDLSLPVYNADHSYTFLANVPAGPLTFGVDDVNPADNAGSFTVTIGLSAQVRVDPTTINLRSRGNWISAKIELPAGYSPLNINRASLLANGVVPAVARPWSASGDSDRDGLKELMVKFNRNAVQALMTPGNFPLTITGSLNDGTPFSGTATVRVINPGRSKR